MSKRFMPGMIMLNSNITPGSSTDFNHGEGTFGEVYIDPSSGMFFEYRDGDKGVGWYGDDDETFYISKGDEWIPY